MTSNASHFLLGHKSLYYTQRALTNSPTYFHTAYWRGYIISRFIYKQYVDLFFIYTPNTAATKIITKNLYDNSLKCQLHTGKQFMNRWKGFKQQVFVLHSKRTCGRNIRTKQGTPDNIWARLKMSPGKSLSRYVQQTDMSTSLKEQHYCICNHVRQQWFTIYITQIAKQN